MSLQDTLKKNLTPELFNSVIDQLGDDFDYDLVPRSRLNKVIKQRNDLRDQLASNVQPNDVSSEEFSDTNVKKDSIEDIETLKAQLKTKSDEAIKAVKIQYAALEKLRAAGIIDADLVWSSNAIDKTKLSLDDSDTLVGLDDIITQLQKDKAHLFKNNSENNIPKGTGKDSSEEVESVTTKESFLKLPADKQIAFKNANPEIFKTFMSAL